MSDKFQIARSPKGSSVMLSDDQKKSIQSYAAKNGLNYENALCSVINIGIMESKNYQSKVKKLQKAEDGDEDDY